MVRRTHKYADGGKIVQKPEPKPETKPKPKEPDKISASAPVESGKKLKSIREKQMEDLGL